MRFIRRIVSKNNRRFQDDGFDLDLAYVTRGIIAMGYPSEGGEGLYRNPMSETVEFLNRYHKGRYRVYNLCSEKAYDATRFGGDVVKYPCSDLQAPPLYLIKLFCEDISSWLDADAENVAAVHCKAGRGRTGVLISCLLLWMRVCSKPEEAIRYYGDARTVNGRAVTIPSQIRYIHHFHDMFLEVGPNRTMPPLIPKRVRFHSLSVLGLPRHLINGATFKLSARGKDEASANKVVFSLRAYTRDEWRCFGPLPAGHREDFRLYVPGNKVQINRATFKPSDTCRRRARGSMCWWGRDKTPGTMPSGNEGSTDSGDNVQARWGVGQGNEETTPDSKDWEKDEPPGKEISPQNCQRGGSDESRLEKEEKGKYIADRNSPMDFVFDWDFNFEVCSCASGGRASLFHTWENTAYLPESGVLILKRDQLDRVKKSVHTVVVEIRFKDVDKCREEDDTSWDTEGEEGEEGGIHAPKDWSCMASAVSHCTPPEVALSEVGSESQSSTTSQPPRGFLRSFPSLSIGQLAWLSWSSTSPGLKEEVLASSISPATLSAWHSLDAAWSQGWLGVPTSHSLGLAKV